MLQSPFGNRAEECHEEVLAFLRKPKDTPGLRSSRGHGWARPRLLIVGHTHERMAFIRHRDEASGKYGWWAAERNRVGDLPLSADDPICEEQLKEGYLDHDEDGYALIINPGSVGQNRETLAAAGYAIINFDLDAGTFSVRFRLVPYEVVVSQNRNL
jgi:hypothetical protein